MMKNLTTTLVAVCLLTAVHVHVWGQEADIRKHLTERIPQMDKIDEVSKTPIPGIFEVRVGGTDIFYTDAQADFLLQGQIIDIKQQKNLTEDRVARLTAISFDALPVKDAFTVVRGTGKRRLAVFEDPNCGYCKRFEQDLQKVDNITIQMFLYPVLGADSVEKSKNLWCAKDRVKAWQDWMLRNQPPKATACDTAAIDRNMAIGRKHKITGTPTLLFSNGTRIPGAIGTDQIEKLLTQSGG